MKARVLGLASSISVRQETLSPRQVLFHGIEFRLDRALLDRCLHARDRSETLQLPAKLLTEMRHYVLATDAIDFSTSYREGDREETVIRSLVSYDGEISCQICHHYLQNEALILGLTAAHHWLTQQTLRELYFQAQRRIEWLAWLLAVLIVGAIAFWQRSRIPLGDPITWFIALAAIWLLHLLIAPLVRQARRRYWRQLLFGR